MAVSFTPTTVANPEGVQGSYPQQLVKGHEGMIADLQAYVCRTYRNQSGAALPFGALLAIDNTPTSNDVYAADLAAAATNIVGIAASTYTFEANTGGSAYTPNPTPVAADGSGRIGYPDKASVNVLSKGVLWVYTAEAVAMGDAVRAFITNYNGTLAGAYQGRFGKSAVAANTVLLGGARWLSETTAAGLALLELDIPATTFTADV